MPPRGTAGAAHPETRPESPPSRRAIPCLLAGAAAFLATAAALHVAVPWRPRVPVLSEKRAFYREHRNDHDILFLGSSRVYHHIDPARFDEAAASAGLRTRSFNLGVDALSIVELSDLVDEIVAMAPSSLAHVLIEPTFFTNIPLRNLYTERIVAAHDLDATLLEVRVNLEVPRYRWTLDRNLRACLYHYLNLGRAASLVLHASHAGPPGPSVDDLAATRGFVSLDELPDPGALKRHVEFLADRERYARRLSAPLEVPAGERRHYATRNRILREIAGRLRRLGVEPVFVITPGFHDVEALQQFHLSHREEPGDVPLMSYLEGHEDLYDLDLWYDSAHLNGEGAARFSRRLGEDVARLARGRRDIE